MTKPSRRFLVVLIAVAAFGMRLACAQQSSAGNEDLVVGDAVSGDLNPATPAVPAENLAVEAAPAAALPVETLTPASPETDGTAAPKSQEKPLEEVVAEIVGEKPESAHASSAAAAEQPAVDLPVAADVETLPGSAMENTPVAETPGAVEMPKLQKADAPSPELSGEVVKIREAEELRRKAYEAHAMDLIAEGEGELQAKRYDEARKAFAEASKTLAIVSRAENRAARQRARLGVQASIYNQAMLKMKQGDLAGAEQAAREAMAEGHPKANALLKEIERLKSAVPPPPAPPAHRWQTDDFKSMEKRVREKLQTGREFYLTGEYEKALNAFESVLKDDPQNTEAIRWREKVSLRRYSIADDEFRSTRADMMADVRRTWNPRDYGQQAGENVAKSSKIVGPSSEEELRRQRIIEKLGKIIIPEVDFRQAYVTDVINFLQASSVEFDKDDTGAKGVNIILNLGPTTSAASGAGASAEGEAATPSLEKGGADMPLITFKARDISLLEALRIVTSVANLQYAVQGNIVMVMRDTAAILPIVHRSYDVLASVGERIATVTKELGAGGGAEGDVRTIGGGEIDTTGSDQIDWKKFFGELGVKWPDGSSIRYLKSIGKIMVANTTDNLAVFEQRLSELNVVPSQIEIEARFVEVEQNDLSALGFEWLLTDDWEIAHNKNAPEQRIVMPADVGTATKRGGFTQGLRLPSDGVSATLPGSDTSVSLGTVQDKMLTIASVLTNPELTMILHLLQQKGNTDLLSAPKVTTQSGVEATIKVVTEYIYPTEFDITEIHSSGTIGTTSTIIGGIVEPGSFETREVGVILQVLPEVSAEGQMISLTLAPEVVTEPVWKDYGMDFPSELGELIHLPMPQPFFHTRSVSTSIIIYNGATVVMGGMITENHNAVDDKIPLLGDLPLIGHLFRSQMDQSVKRNLLIFVTARLVDPAGFEVGRPTLPTVAAPAERPNG